MNTGSKTATNMWLHRKTASKFGDNMGQTEKTSAPASGYEILQPPVDLRQKALLPGNDTMGDLAAIRWAEYGFLLARS